MVTELPPAGGRASENAPAGQPGLRRGVTIAAVGLVCAAVVAVLAWYVDGPVSRAVHEAGLDMALRRKGTWARAISEVMKTPGEWYYALAVAAGVYFARAKDLSGALLVAGGALMASSNAIVKWIAGRQRPFRDGAFNPDPWSWELFRHGIEVWRQTNLSFPSGHACNAFAVATAVWLTFPRWGWLALLPAVMTACERVMSNSHYVSEVVGGGMLGAAGTLVVRAVLRRFGPGRARSVVGVVRA